MLMICLLLMSCEKIGLVNNQQVCVGWKPIYINKGDIVSEETAKEILAHNLYGQKNKCW